MPLLYVNNEEEYFDILKTNLARHATYCSSVCRLTVLNGIVTKGIKADLCDMDIAGLTWLQRRGNSRDGTLEPALTLRGCSCSHSLSKNKIIVRSLSISCTVDDDLAVSRSKKGQDKMIQTAHRTQPFSVRGKRPSRETN